MTTEAELTIHRCECDICQAGTDSETAQHHHHMNLLLTRLNEPQRRWYVGHLSQKSGSPSDRQLSLITGLDVFVNRKQGHLLIEKKATSDTLPEL